MRGAFLLGGGEARGGGGVGQDVGLRLLCLCWGRSFELRLRRIRCRWCRCRTSMGGKGSETRKKMSCRQARASYLQSQLAGTASHCSCSFSGAGRLQCASPTTPEMPRSRSWLSALSYTRLPHYLPTRAMAVVSVMATASSQHFPKEWVAMP